MTDVDGQKLTSIWLQLGSLRLPDLMQSKSRKPCLTFFFICSSISQTKNNSISC